MKKEKTKIGLALSGGAARGYAHIPIIQKLLKENIEIDMISGSSVGALIGAYFALYGEVDSLLEKLEKMSWKDWLKLIDLQNPKKSLIKGEKIRKFLEKEFFQDKTFKDTKIKLIIVATDVVKNKPVYFTSGKIIDAIMYSIAIPGVFPLSEYKNKILTDGQVAEHLPVNILFEKGMEKVIGVDVIKNVKIEKEEIQNSSLNLLLLLFYRSLVTSKFDDKKTFIFEPEFKKNKSKIGNNLRFDKIKENLKPGKEVIKKEWKNLKNFLEN